MNTSLSMFFYLKKSKRYKGGPADIYLRVTVNCRRTEFSVQRKCEPEKWSSEMGKAIGNKEDIKKLNLYLDAIERSVYDLQRICVEKNEPISLEKVRNHLSGQTQRVDKSRMILEIFQKHNDQVKALVGKEFSPGTLERYITARQHVKRFMELQYKVSDMSIADLNYDFICEYAFFLKTNRNCGHNSAMKYIANFKKIVLLCVKKGWLTKDPVLRF